MRERSSRAAGVSGESTAPAPSAPSSGAALRRVGIARQHPDQHEGDDDQQERIADEVRYGADGGAERHHPDGFRGSGTEDFGQVAGERDLERRRATEPAVPHQKPRVARCCEQWVVHGHAAFPRALSDLPCQKRPCDQAEPPVDEREQHGARRHDGDRAGGGPGAVGEAIQRAAHRRARCEGVSRHQDQAHLHAEGEQVPEALAVAAAVEPGREHARRVGPHVGEGQRERHERQEHRQHERIGDETPCEAGQGAAESLEHRTAPDARRWAGRPPGAWATLCRERWL